MEAAWLKDPVEARLDELRDGRVGYPAELVALLPPRAQHPHHGVRACDELLGGRISVCHDRIVR